MPAPQPAIASSASSAINRIEEFLVQKTTAKTSSGKKISTAALKPERGTSGSTTEAVHIGEAGLLEVNLIEVNLKIREMIKTALEELQAQSVAPYCIFVSTLSHPDLSVVKPIPVVIEPEPDGSFVASFIDAGISSGGNSVREATWSLQQLIASSYKILADMNDSKLGPKMRRERMVLMEFICHSPKPTQNPRHES